MRCTEAFFFFFLFFLTEAIFSRESFYSVGVTHVELKRDKSIFRVAGSVTFDPVREDGEAG